MRIGSVAGAGLIFLTFMFLAMFPVSAFKPLVENRLSKAIKAPVTIQSLSRRQIFSFSPDIVIEALAIKQPDWAGPGNLITAKKIEARMAVWDVITGDPQPQRVLLEGVRLNLIRDESGRGNWSSDQREEEDNDPSALENLENLSVRDFRFSFDDRKRKLELAGSMEADARKGLTINATGDYRGTPATLTATGGAFATRTASRDYPFSLSLKSPAAQFEADGTMRGILNVENFEARMTAAAPDLKNIDYLIEAGLFGTQPVSLKATVSHQGRDWIITDLRGTVGRSNITGNADVLKRDGRTKVSGAIRASAFDFDDLADDAGRARAAALRARTGPRILPNTRINLSKIGKTDISLDFHAERLLSRHDSVFRSLSATVTLDNRLVKATNVVAKMDSGVVTGTVMLDHRTGAPKLSTDLRIKGASLQSIIGSPDTIAGPVEGLIRLNGQGDTVRQALSKASGKAVMVTRRGTIKAIVADVIGQDLGKTIGQAIDGPSKRDPLHCLIASFDARSGRFTPSPLVISAGSSVGRGFGVINLDGEAIALTIRGAAVKQSPLKIADPIQIGGTLSAPKISVGGFSSKNKPTVGGALKIVTKSIGGALGIGDKKAPKVKSVPVPVNCNRLASVALK